MDNERPDRTPETGDSPEDLLGLEDFNQPADDGGLSLESLSAAYAELLDQGAVPYEPPAEDAAQDDGEENDEPLEVDQPRGLEISPRSILEAMLFVGNSENMPLTSQQVAAFMRGVRPKEIEDLIVDLNREYDELGCPYRIAAVEAGFLMQLREEHRGLRSKFHRRVRDARLSQGAVEVLAIVAYRQPVQRDEVDRLRGRPSGGVLSQLVRRQLLRIERPADRPRRPNYYTTDRFLSLFGLGNLGELPQSQQIDRDF